MSYNKKYIYWTLFLSDLVDSLLWSVQQLVNLSFYYLLVMEDASLLGCQALCIYYSVLDWVCVFISAKYLILFHVNILPLTWKSMAWKNPQKNREKKPLTRCDWNNTYSVLFGDEPDPSIWCLTLEGNAFARWSVLDKCVWYSSPEHVTCFLD